VLQCYAIQIRELPIQVTEQGQRGKGALRLRKVIEWAASRRMPLVPCATPGGKLRARLLLSLSLSST
jgi:hypothetical protein